MNKYSIPLQIRWSDIDQNRHLRHSVYYDFGTMVRINFLSSHGLTAEKMDELQIGPILFREEAVFRREIKPNDRISIDFELVRSTPDYSKWTFRHHIVHEDGKAAAILNIDGAWLDLKIRKLVAPVEFVQQVFAEIPKSTDFQLVHSFRSTEIEK